MALHHSTTTISSAQVGPGLTEVKAILNSVDATALLERLRLYRWTCSRWRGRSGYSVEALWRAVLLSYILNVSSTSALIRRLQDDPRLRRVCGFRELPHRSTFSGSSQESANIRNSYRSPSPPRPTGYANIFPTWGIRSRWIARSCVVTPIPTGAPSATPKPSWTAKNSTSPGAKNGKEWSFGYKLHMVADAEYGIPLWSFITPANRNDTLELPTLLDGAASAHPWFHPAYVIADKGYDSQANHTAVVERGAVPVIHLRRLPNRDLQDGIYTQEGIPTCIGNVPMEYVRSDPEKGHLYRCPAGGCALKNRKGVLGTAKTRIWERPQGQSRGSFGVITA